MRNVAGVLAQRKLSRALMASLNNAGTPFRWLHGPTGAWAETPGTGSAGLEMDLRGLTWEKGRHSRTVFFNLRVPTIRNSVDLCLLDCSTNENQIEVVHNPARYVALGELKGGIDPAGADEHGAIRWKSAGAVTRAGGRFALLHVAGTGRTAVGCHRIVSRPAGVAGDAALVAHPSDVGANVAENNGLRL